MRFSEIGVFWSDKDGILAPLLDADKTPGVCSETMRVRVPAVGELPRRGIGLPEELIPLELLAVLEMTPI